MYKYHEHFTLWVYLVNLARSPLMSTKTLKKHWGQVGFTLTPEDNTSSPHWDLACDTQESFTQLLTLIDRQGKWTHK